MLPLSTEEEITAVLDSPWDMRGCGRLVLMHIGIAVRNNEHQYGLAADHMTCALCPGARAYDLLPCCGCTNWVHTNLSKFNLQSVRGSAQTGKILDFARRYAPNVSGDDF